MNLSFEGKVALITGAGGGIGLATADEEFDRIIDINLRGVWNCMKAELRQMMVQGSGAIDGGFLA